MWPLRGISSVINQQDMACIKQLGILSQLRGTDSTGIYTVDRGKKRKLRWHIHRELGDSSSFLAKQPVRDILSRPSTCLVVGHTRYTTNGVTNLHNAHPIQEKHIVGCHNGVIRSLEPAYNDQALTTDSRKLFGKIAEKGLEKAVADIPYGTMALTYIDKEQRTFNIFRNNLRELWLVPDKDETTFLWASEKEMLDLVLQREGLTRTWKTPWLVPPFKLLTWQIGRTANYTITDIGQPLTPYVRPVTTYTSSALTTVLLREESPFVQEQDPWCGDCWELLPDCSCVKPPPGTSDRRYLWFKSQVTPVSTMEPMLAEGCFSCRRQFRVEDSVIWPHWDYYLCKECTTAEFYREALKHQECYEGKLLN